MDTDLKFWHHTSGDVRFSKSGFRQPLPRKKSSPLPTGSGPVFWLFAYRLKDFVWLEEPRKKEHTTLIQCDHHPMGLRLEANWMSIKALEQSAHGQIGPGSKMVHRESGKETDVFFIGPHRDASHQGGVLVCTARDQALPDGVNDTGTMIFMGGFDSGSDVPVSQRKCLAFLYPAGDFHDESQSEPSGSSTS